MSKSHKLLIYCIAMVVGFYSLSSDGMNFLISFVIFISIMLYMAWRYEVSGEADKAQLEHEAAQVEINRLMREVEEIEAKTKALRHSRINKQ